MNYEETALAHKNLGFYYKNVSQDFSPEDPATLIVSGLGRSGTTMVARIIESAGIFMGDAFHSEKNTMKEDIGLALAIENGNLETIHKIVSRRNAKYTTWGFKRPLIFRYQELIQENFRNPRYIVIFRDPLAIGLRNTISMGFSLEKSLEVFHRQMKRNIEFIRTSSAPMLLISYEKMLVNPDSILNEIMWFSGVRDFEVENIRDLILPDEPTYISKAAPRN